MSIYATKSDVEALIKFISDTPTDDLLERVLLNADSIINNRLTSHNISTSDLENTDDYNILNTVAVYYAVSDVLQSLYTGDDLPSQYNTYMQKAESMLSEYIVKMENELAETSLKKHNPIRHHKGLTYRQKQRQGR